MRDILFRGKRTDNGEWVYGGSVIQFVDNGVKSVYMPSINDKYMVTHEDKTDNIIGFDTCVFYKIAPETVGQYTGRECYKGNVLTKIFEGDICEVTVFDYNGTDKQYKCEVIYLNGAFYFVGINDFYLSLAEIEDAESDVEILGNIHDNPELLKERQQ